MGSELERVRADMLELLADPRVEGFWDNLGSVLGHRQAGRSPADLRKVFLFGLRNAALYSLDADAAKAAESRALAGELMDLTDEDLPSPHGLLLFGTPVTAYRVLDESKESGEVTLSMTGLLWTDASSPTGERGVTVYALVEDVHMPAFALVLPYGRRLAGGTGEQAVFFKIMQECWRVSRERREVAPNLERVEARESTLPDGARIVIAVKPGLTQDEVDLLAVELWQNIPEG